jgi:endonuclease YncB( thermonuclease family)
LRALGLVLLAFAVLAGPLSGVADARRAPCIPGLKKQCRVWTAKVMAVADGDTINVRIRQHGRWSTRKDVRMLGIQAMELKSYSRARKRYGECHSVKAAKRLEHLLQGRKVKRRRVRLAAFRARSRTAGRRGRLLRGVAYRRGGHWHDAGAVLMREGHVLWDPHNKEWAWNRRYAKLAGRAANSGRNLWDTDFCGTGPAEGAQLRLGLKWDAYRNDGTHVNGEWIRIRNRDPASALPLHRWWVRDSALRRFRLPRTAVVPPGGSIRVRVGRGTDNAANFFWGQPDPVFDNAKRGRRAIGDGAYLFDPQGDLRAWRMYPCRVACAGPLR